MRVSGRPVKMNDTIWLTASSPSVSYRGTFAREPGFQECSAAEAVLVLGGSDRGGGPTSASNNKRHQSMIRWAARLLTNASY